MRSMWKKLTYSALRFHFLCKPLYLLFLQRVNKKISVWDDLLNPGVRIGLGNSKTMALGRSYEKIKEKMGTKLTGKIDANKVVEGVNVSQIVNYLKQKYNRCRYCL